jgi:hypothetical protein
MPISLLGAGAGIAGSLIGGLFGNRAADAQRKAAEANARLIGQRYDQTRGDFQPYMGAGQQALGQWSQLNSGDYSGFANSPDYLAAKEMGLEGLDRRAAAYGNLGSGGTDADRIGFASNLASQQLGAYRNSLMGMAGMGANMTSNLGTLGAQYTGQQTGQNNLAGAARASGYNALGGAVQDAFAVGGRYLGGRG